MTKIITDTIVDTSIPVYFPLPKAITETITLHNLKTEKEINLNEQKTYTLQLQKTSPQVFVARK
jgi:hypothetical protein